MSAYVTLVIYVSLVIRGLDEKTRREIRSEAARRGLRLAQALREAISVWQSQNMAGSVQSERDANNAIYESVKEELKQHSGKTALIAEGKILGFFDSPKEASAHLRAHAPNARHAIITVIGKDKREELEWLAGSMNL